MTSLPDMANSKIGKNAPLEFEMAECAECAAQSPWIDSYDIHSAHHWKNIHYSETGHSTFFMTYVKRTISYADRARTRGPASEEWTP